MKLILIYQPEDADKNKEYIKLYENECKRRGLECTLKITGRPGCGVTDFAALTDGCSPDKDIFINRSRDAVLTEYLEAIKNTVSYKHWIFGHYHDDRVIDDKETLVYRKMIRI